MVLSSPLITKFKGWLLVEEKNKKLSIEEVRLRIEEKRLDIDNSFAKKWLPTLVTLMAGLIAGMFSYVQQQNAIQTTEQTRIEAKSRAEREWGFKVIEMYFSKHEFFDLSKNPEQAESNLRVLAAVAPVAVQSVLNAERSKIPAPTGINDLNRLDSLSAVAGVQDALKKVRQSEQIAAKSFKPPDFTIYLQYPQNSKDVAIKTQNYLINLGYNTPSIDKVNKAPSRLQVRYYRSEQRYFAEKLATKLGTVLKLSTSSDNTILLTSLKQLPSGILEVWLPQE